MECTQQDFGGLSSVAAGADGADDARRDRSFQPGFGASDGSSHCIGCKESSSTSGYHQEEVGTTHPRGEQQLIIIRRFNWLYNVHTAEVFPLALASAAVIQQATFVAVQSTSFGSVVSTQCRGLAMATLPGRPILNLVKSRADRISHLHRRVRHTRFRCRNGMEISEVGTIRASR